MYGVGEAPARSRSNQRFITPNKSQPPASATILHSIAPQLPVLSPILRNIFKETYSEFSKFVSELPPNNFQTLLKCLPLHPKSSYLCCSEGRPPKLPTLLRNKCCSQPSPPIFSVFNLVRLVAPVVQTCRLLYGASYVQ